MPHPEIERLGRDSSKGQISAAVSACIATEIRGGKTQDEAAGMCHGMARQKTGGKPPAPKGGS